MQLKILSNQKACFSKMFYFYQKCSLCNIKYKNKAKYSMRMQWSIMTNLLFAHIDHMQCLLLYLYGKFGAVQIKIGIVYLDCKNVTMWTNRARSRFLKKICDNVCMHTSIPKQSQVTVNIHYFQTKNVFSMRYMCIKVLHCDIMHCLPNIECILSCIMLSVPIPIRGFVQVECQSSGRHKLISCQAGNHRLSS